MKARSSIALYAGAALFAAGHAAASSTGWTATIERPFKNEHTVELLRELAADASPALRAEALRALARSGAPADRALIRAALDSPHASVRIAAVRAAAAVGMQAGARTARALLTDPSPEVRAAFFDALPDLRVADPQEAARAGWDDAHAAVRAAAAGAALRGGATLADWRDRLASEDDAAVLQGVFNAGVAASTGAQRRAWLTWALEQPHAALRLGALEAVRGDDDALAGAAVAALSAPVESVARAGAAACLRLHAAEALSPALRRLPAAGPALRVRLCELLSLFPREEAIDALAGRLAGDDDFYVRRAAARALLRAHTPSALNALAAGLTHRDERTRAVAARAIGAWGDPAAAPLLFPALDDESPQAALAVLQALHELRNPGAGAHAPRIRQRLDAEDPQIVAAATDLLAWLGDDSIVPRLKDTLTRVRSDDPWQPRRAALDALRVLEVGDMLARAVQFVNDTVIPPGPMEMEWTYDGTQVRIAALRYVSAFGDAATARSMLADLEETAPRALRPPLAATMQKLTGVRYDPLPDHSYDRYPIRSTRPPSIPSVPPPPGIRPAGG